MKITFTLPVILAIALTSCTKVKTGTEEFTNKPVQEESRNPTVRTGSLDNPHSILLHFGILALDDGDLKIKEAETITGNIGYSAGVKSKYNEDIASFTGTAYVHSHVEEFIYDPATYQPTGGIIQNDLSADSALERANLFAQDAAADFLSITPHLILGNLNTSYTINRYDSNTVVSIHDLNLNTDVLTLIGQPGADDGFIINVAGKFKFEKSEVRLINVRPERVIFNYTGNGEVNIKKDLTVFNGTILALIGKVHYHDHGIFNGAILAKKIDVHSGLNFTQHDYTYYPIP